MVLLAPDILERLKLSAVVNTDFRFFDQTFSVKTDKREVVESFKNIFFRFHIPGHSKASENAYYILGKGNFLGRPLLVVENRNYFLDNEHDLAGFAYMKIMDSLLSKIESHTLFHGASLSYNGQGVIFPAASKSGKSTTTLELVKRGFSFLSDDISALSRKDKKLYPFPKKIGLLPDALKLYPEIGLKNLGSFPMLGGAPGKNKRPIDIDDLFTSGSLGKPSPLSHLIFLGHLPEKRTSPYQNHRIFVVLNRVTDALLKKIQEEKGVLDASLFPDKQKFPILKIDWVEPFPGLSRLEDICYLNETLIYDHTLGSKCLTDFNSTPELRKIPKSEAIFHLLKELNHSGLKVLHRT